MRVVGLAAGLILTAGIAATPQTQSTGLGTPGFHHLHLNSVDPARAVAFYAAQFPSTSATTFSGQPALQSGNVLVLFEKVAAPPPTEPQSAYWHFGWHVVSSHQRAEEYRRRPGLTMYPLYVTDVDEETVTVSTDSWPGNLTKAQIAQAKANGVKPDPKGGFAYLGGPDRTLIEYQGDLPRERFNHVHMWEQDPYCAEVWYDTHLNAKPSPGRPRTNPVRPPAAECRVAPGERTWPSLERRGTIRFPSAGVAFDDVDLLWYPNQDAAPLADSRGQLMDHIGLSVSSLSAWEAKLRSEGVRILSGPYPFGDTKALLIEGPSREAIELVERK